MLVQALWVDQLEPAEELDASEEDEVAWSSILSVPAHLLETYQLDAMAQALLSRVLALQQAHRRTAAARRPVASETANMGSA
eukprot:3546128-Rhodomonas_salina.1